MNKKYYSRFCGCQLTCKPKDTLESLKKELDYIKEDINTIKQMQISEESKEPALKELQEQVNNVKERMHKLVDEM